MPRKQKQKVEVNNTDSLQGLMQETYNDTCLQISEAQSAINELSTSVSTTESLDVDDATKIAKEKGGLLKVKDSAIRIKLEVAKLMSDIIKNNGDADAAIKNASNGAVSLDDFDAIREMIASNKNSALDDNE